MPHAEAGAAEEVVPFVGGPTVDRHGEPERTICRMLLLTALREADPDIVSELQEECGKAAADVLATAGVHDQPRHLLLLRSLLESRKNPKRGDVSERMAERTESRIRLLAALLKWAAYYHLSDDSARRNPWLLEHALDVLRGREWGHLSTGVGQQSAPGRAFRVRLHGAPRPGSELGPLARDFDLLARYVCVLEVRTAFAPDIPHPRLIRLIRSAATRAGFDLPHPLRPNEEDCP